MKSFISGTKVMILALAGINLAYYIGSQMLLVFSIVILIAGVFIPEE